MMYLVDFVQYLISILYKLIKLYLIFLRVDYTNFLIMKIEYIIIETVNIFISN